MPAAAAATRAVPASALALRRRAAPLPLLPGRYLLAPALAESRVGGASPNACLRPSHSRGVTSGCPRDSFGSLK